MKGWSTAILSTRASRIATAVLAAIVLSGALAPWLAPEDPLAVDMAARLLPPGPAHILGTDSLGRDFFSRLLFGGRTAMALSLVLPALSLLLGLAAGVTAGYGGGFADTFITGITNIFLALPGLTLMIAVAGVMGPGLFTIAVALTLTGWTGFSRVVRAEVLQVKQENYVKAARGMGCSHAHLIRRHILPRLGAVCLVTFTTRVSRAMIVISSLSFLGFGLAPPAPDWGGMIREAVFHFRSAPHLILGPGLAVFLFTFSVNLVGDALRDALHVE